MATTVTLSAAERVLALEALEHWRRKAIGRGAAATRTVRICREMSAEWRQRAAEYGEGATGMEAMAEHYERAIPENEAKAAGCEGSKAILAGLIARLKQERQEDGEGCGVDGRRVEVGAASGDQAPAELER